MSTRAVPKDKITGVILAGGLGRRMSSDGQGTDKGLVAFGDQTMAQAVIDRLKPQVGQLLINANRNLEAWRSLGLPVLTDRIEGFAGPLAGLEAALHAATSDWVMTVPCDSPFFPSDLVERLAEAAMTAHAQVAVARTGPQTHPVFALVRRDLQDHLNAFLATGRRRIDAWYAPLDVVEVDFIDEAAFVNINTEQDLQRHAPRISR